MRHLTVVRSKLYQLLSEPSIQRYTVEMDEAAIACAIQVVDSKIGPQLPTKRGLSQVTDLT